MSHPGEPAVTAGSDINDRDSRRFCGGPLKQREGTCTRPAGWGTPHPGIGRCKLHGGSTSSHVKHAQQQQAQELLASLLWNPDAPPITDSVGEMQRLAGSMRQTVDVLGAELEGGLDDAVKATAWLRVLRELRTLLADMKRLGIAEYAVNVEAAKTKLMAVAFGRALDALEAQLGVPLDGGAREEATRVLLSELRSAAEVEGGEVA